MARMIPRFRRIFTVYRWDLDPPSMDPAPDQPVELCRDSVRTIFRSHPFRLEHFLRFLDSGYFGLAFLRESRCVSFGWFSRPGGPQPPHLPAWLRRFKSYWIFHCHTAIEFRGQGCFTRLLIHMVRSMYERSSNPLIHVDTDVKNVASRRGVLSAGFVPRGVMITYQLPIVGFGPWILGGFWNRHTPHPYLPPGRRSQARVPLDHLPDTTSTSPDLRSNVTSAASPTR
jgi:hypothetical protein